MANNRDVAQAWKDGNTAANKGTFLTDGDKLFSYQLLIGVTLNGQKILFDWSSPNFVSATTSRHVGLARAVADIVRTPKPPVENCAGCEDKKLGYECPNPEHN